MPRTTDAPGEPESRTPWWLDEMIDQADIGRGRYEIAIPVTILEDWIANARAALAELAEARPVVAALLLARPALVWYDGLRTIGCNVCDRELPHDGVGDCPHGDHCPVAVSDALAARDGGGEGEGR